MLAKRSEGVFVTLDNICCWHLRQVKPSGRHWRLYEAPEKHRADVTYASVVTSATAAIRFWSGLLPALPRRWL